MRSVFVDTNVLIYARDPAFPTKARQAVNWLTELASRNEAIVSPQILNEFVAVALRRFRGVPLDDVHAKARDLLPWCQAPSGSETSVRAMILQRDYQLSWWDALVVASALQAGCRYLLTEDLQAGMGFEGLTVVDPFATAPETIFIQS
jgi:predicted nucleic acid-binding protein